MHDVLLAVHVAAGAAGLLVGPMAMVAGTRSLRNRRSPDGTWCATYPWVVGVVAASALILVVGYRHDLLWLGPIGLLSWCLAVVGDRAPRGRGAAWSHWYAHGIGGSYIALVTAFVVVWLTVDGPLSGPVVLIPWLAPTMVGTVLIEAWRRHIVTTVPE